MASIFFKAKQFLNTILKLMKRTESGSKSFEWLQLSEYHSPGNDFLDKSGHFTPILQSKYSGKHLLSSMFPNSGICCQSPGIKANWNTRCYSKLRKVQAKEDNLLIRSAVSIVRKTDKWDALLKELCVASSSEITPPIAVQVLKRIKKPELAFKFFDWLENLEGFDHDGLTYSAILKVLTRECNPSHAAIANSLLCKKIDHGFDVTPSDYDYVLHQWARVGRLDVGLLLLDEMTTRGFVPAVSSCSILVEELLDSKKHEDLGWELFYRILGKRIDALDTEVFNVVMKFLCVEGKLEEALDLFSKMKDEDCVPDLDSFNILIKGCCEKGKARILFDLFRYMIDIKVKPNSYTLNLLIKELCKQGRPESGNHLFNYMRRVGWIDRKFVYTQLVESLTNYGWWMKALKIFVKMVRRGHHPKIGLYNNLIQRLCMGGRLREASKLKDLMLSKGFLPEIEIYNGFLDGLCLVGRMEMIEKLLLKLHASGVNPNLETYNIILRGYCMVGDVKAAFEWLIRMKQDRCEPNVKSCRYLMCCLFTEERVVEALKVKGHTEEGDDICHNTCDVLIDKLTKLSDVN